MKMEKKDYISPKALVAEMKATNLLAGSGEEGNVGGSGESDAKHRTVWDED